MQDMPNLKRKLIEYRGYIKQAVLDNDQYHVDYWTDELKWIQDRIDWKNKNRKKDAKLYRKANGGKNMKRKKK